MTTHTPSMPVTDESQDREAGGRQASSGRPTWLMPVIAAALLLGGLVVAGIVSASTALFLVAFGGMMFMHLGGHGHGGHGGTTQSGHGGHGEPAPRDEDLSQPSGRSQPGRSASSHGLHGGVSKDQDRGETTDDDQHASHSCH